MARTLPGLPTADDEIAEPDRHLNFVWRNFFQDLLSYLRNRVPVTSSVTFAAATTATVTFATAEADANYSVWYAATSDNYFWTTSPTTAGFTANAKTSNSLTIRYQLIRA